MNTYRTSEIAEIIGVHPNTVRLYEELGLIPKPGRLPNGYRVFTELHIEQFRLARLAFQIEVLQNGLRKKIVQMVKVSAAGDYEKALELTREYLLQIRQEIANAEEATQITEQILDGRTEENLHTMKRKEVSEYLNISMDTLRNWEMNGLLTVRRRQNGYRVYTDEDIKRLKIIRSLRCANYSLEAILTMLGQVSKNPGIDIKKALDTPKKDTEIIAVCDKLVTSLTAAESNAEKMMEKLTEMKSRFSEPSI
jgi:DNA-binding transcriptional MerR regulator